MNIPQQIAPYGYTVDDTGIVSTPKGSSTGVRIESERGRIRAVSAGTGTLLWTGGGRGQVLRIVLVREEAGMTPRQAIRLLPWPAAWRRAGLFVAKLAALAVLYWLLVITSIDVAVLAARISE